MVAPFTKIITTELMPCKPALTGLSQKPRHFVIVTYKAISIPRNYALILSFWRCHNLWDLIRLSFKESLIKFIKVTLLFVSILWLSSCGGSSGSNAEITPPNTNVIKINIDWERVVRKVPLYAYGINSPANFIPAYSNNLTFMSNLKSITQKKGFICLHGWGMLGDSPEAWQKNGVWDSTKINQALRPLVEDGYTVMINVPSGPQGENDYRDPKAFAKFCADLVRTVNIEHGLGIKYWEIPNERESDFSDPGLSVSQMAILIKTASVAMKAVDPSIKVGGQQQHGLMLIFLLP